MSDYENQFQVTAKHYDSEMNKIEQNGGEDLAPEDQGSDPHVYDWADVLRDLEPYY